MRKLGYVLIFGGLLVSFSSCKPNDPRYKNPSKVDDTLLNKFDNFSNTLTHQNKLIMNEPVLNDSSSPDPFVFRYNGMYYLYATTGGGYIRCYESSNLVEWIPSGDRGICYDYSQDKNHPASQTPYAPEVTYFNGKFYMITSPSGNGHYILESDAPNGPFYAQGDNLKRSIDGSFFIDKDEQMYFYGADGAGIYLYKLNDEISNVTTSLGSYDEYIMLDAKVGPWNEGPYMLLRNGKYYLTYCGTHYKSVNYRVDYLYGGNEADITSSSDFTRQGTCLISTEDDFNGLGHSCTVLGPDMDSYFMAYHNLEKTGARYLNLSRLSFNGGRMILNGVRPGELNQISLPEFYSYDFLNDENVDNVGEFMLSNVSSNSSYTVEFNVTGNGKMIFGYQDSNNYNYINFSSSNKIEIGEYKNNTNNVLKLITLNKEYSNEVNHTFRLQYKDKKMNFYFDGIEKVALEDIALNGGKIGFYQGANQRGFSDIGYVAFSNVALGSSDSVAYDEDISLANSYIENLSYLSGYSGLEMPVLEKESKNVTKDSEMMRLYNKDDRATYGMYAKEDGTYNLDIRMSPKYLNKKVGVRIDDGEIFEVALKNLTPKDANGDFIQSIGNYSLTSGPHYISIYNVGDEIAFSELHYEKDCYGEYKTYDFVEDSDILGDFKKRKDFDFDSNGLILDGKYNVGILSKEEYRNYSLTAEFKVNEKMVEENSFSILGNITDYGENNLSAVNYELNECFVGYKFSVKNSLAILTYADYRFSQKIKSAKISLLENDTNTIKMSFNDGLVDCYVNDELVISVALNVANRQGKIGILGYGCNVSVQKLTIENND